MMHDIRQNKLKADYPGKSLFCTSLPLPDVVGLPPLLREFFNTV